MEAVLVVAMVREIEDKEFAAELKRDLLEYLMQVAGSTDLSKTIVLAARQVICQPDDG